MDFFISHAGRDRAWAEWVAWQLENAGYSVELAAWHWAPGDNFVTKMADALENAGRVVALFSKSYFSPESYATEEWSAAFVKNDQGRLLPLVVEDCEIPRLLSPLIHLQLHGLDEEEAGTRLLQAARGPQLPDGKPVFPPNQQPSAQGPRPSLPGTRPTTWNVPLGNSDFTGRDLALVSLRERLLGRGIQVVHGMGGIGKSQLATEYAHRFQGNYDLVWWIDAERSDLIGEQFAALAVNAELVTTTVDHTAAWLAVRKRLREGKRWLLVFDNADDYERLKPWWPEGAGHTLITSRNPGWTEVAGRTEVDVFARTESIAMLRALHHSLSEADADVIAEELGDLPLALAQAGGALAESGMTAGEYLDLLKTHTTELLDDNRPSSYPVTLAAAVTLSLDRLSAEDEAAARLVDLCAMMAPAPIATAWFASSRAGVLADVPPDRLALKRIIGRIGRYGLAKVGDGIQLHRLVIAVLRDRLPAERRVVLRSQAEKLLADMEPEDCENPALWPLWAQLLPHIVHLDAGSSDGEGFRALAGNAALYLLRRGDGASALPYVKNLYEEWSVRHGPDDVNTLRAATEYAHSLFLINDVKAALHVVEETLPRWQRVFGRKDPKTLRSVHDLSVLMSWEGRFAEANRLAKEVWEIRRETLGEEHVDTLVAMQRYANTLTDMPQPNDGIDILKDVRDRQRRVQGVSHPSTISSTSYLAGAYRKFGNHDAARAMAEEALSERMSVLGEDHTSTIESVRVLADILVTIGKYEEANLMISDLLARARMVLGDGHRETLSAIYTSINLYTHIGKFSEALRLAKELYSHRVAAVGENGREALDAGRMIGYVLLHDRRFVQARAQLAAVRARQLNLFDPGHQDPLSTSYSLAITLYHLGNLSRAKKVAQDTLKGYEHIFGNGSYRVQGVAGGLAPIFRAQSGKAKRRK